MSDPRSHRGVDRRGVRPEKPSEKPGTPNPTPPPGGHDTACPTCGAHVRVVQAAGGTAHYEPDIVAALDAYTDEPTGLSGREMLEEVLWAAGANEMEYLGAEDRAVSPEEARSALRRLLNTEGE